MKRPPTSEQLGRPRGEREEDGQLGGDAFRRCGSGGPLSGGDNGYRKSGKRLQVTSSFYDIRAQPVKEH